jgi:hypothetical protein
MNANKKQNLLTEELIQKTVALRKMLESLIKNSSSKEIYIEILVDIEKVLSNYPIDLKRLRQDKIGIGRIVTDYLKTIETVNKE